ncbi:MAG TPA: hypothetical protein VN695_06840 [Streptosporangiaceae bacterium]|nr:hypothetical protein [Streptosporangiaceae bacterium]
MKPIVQSQVRHRRSAGVLAVIAALASTAMTASLALASGSAQASPTAAARVHYHFRTINNGNDTTFNQLLGINDKGKIAGYFGSGVAGHPNKGYTLTPPYRQVNYRNQNFPGSKQTQVTALNTNGIQVGFYSTNNKANPANNNNFGYYSINGSHFHKVNFPAKHPQNPPVDQLLGVNNHRLAVGFYLDSGGNSHGYLYDINTHKYIGESLPISGVTSVTPTGINDPDSVTGFFTNSTGKVQGFLVRKAAPHLIIINVPHSDSTMPFGVNKFGVVVGVYTKGSSSFGFTWSRGHGFQTINDPLGVGNTFVNGINSAGDLVGFYVGKHGNTNGFLATP